MFYIIMFIIPIIAMKTFSEEKRQKTDQALLTSPTSLTEIVLGKFLGAFILYSICCSIFLLYAVVISFFAQPQWSVVLCTFLGILLLGGSFIAINVFISALTESMIVAAVAGMAIGLIIDMMTYFISMISITWIADLLGKINFINYYQNFTYGVLSIVLEKRRWS